MTLENLLDTLSEYVRVEVENMDAERLSVYEYESHKEIDPKYYGCNVWQVTPYARGELLVTIIT